jgi:peptidoglycan/xylan/chitin deacetylase (PgdA/CDA1 family)
VALEDYTLERMDAELAEAQEQIHGRLGVRPVTFAYPCGQTFVGRGESLKSYVPLIAKRFLAGRAYHAEIHNDPAFCDLARAEGAGFDGLSFEQAKPLIDTAAAAGAWLILVGHEVGPPKYHFVGEEALEQVCRYCLEQGIWIDTVAAVAGHVTEARKGAAVAARA